MQEFKDYCKQKNQFGCYFCLSLNCLARQKASNAAKIKRVFNSKYPKKQLTLGEIKALATKAPNDSSQNTLNNSTATVTTPNTAEYGHAHEINAIFDSMDSAPDKHLESGFANNMAEIKTNHNITEEKLKTRMHYWSSSDPKAMDSDKSCIVCNKKKMNWNRYAMHLEVSHDLYMMEDNSMYLELEEVIYCWGIWIQDLSENPPSPDPRYYDSEKGCAISDFNSES